MIFLNKTYASLLKNMLKMQHTCSLNSRVNRRLYTCIYKKLSVKMQHSCSLYSRVNHIISACILSTIVC